jgi:hypothetical protein
MPPTTSSEKGECLELLVFKAERIISHVRFKFFFIFFKLSFIVYLFCQMNQLVVNVSVTLKSISIVNSWNFGSKSGLDSIHRSLDFVIIIINACLLP